MVTIIASGSGDNNQIMRFKGLSIVKSIEGHTDKVNDVAFCPDSATIAFDSADKTIKL